TAVSAFYYCILCKLLSASTGLRMSRRQASAKRNFLRNLLHRHRNSGAFLEYCMCSPNTELCRTPTMRKISVAARLTLTVYNGALHLQHGRKRNGLRLEF